ncbi:hypothetical protein [Streptomyces brevispora]|uniref:Uncharacterized protein n=1 Tax=Streptomyces brevispora TaxID=887462 RepID=A0ABZ1G383_9ACTN|nr:hypothetical protein [Streptomyces brevispora]WSC14344.1 hypothetical protein OIE64_16840 [Streptomyces brevispora]
MFSYTPAEKRTRRQLVRKGARLALAGLPPEAAKERRIDRIDAAAEERGRRELNALHAVRETDRQAVATAKAQFRTAARGDRSAARQRVRDAEQQLRRSERAVDKAERQ